MSKLYKLKVVKPSQLRKALPEKPSKDKPLPTGAHRTPPKGYPKDRNQYAIPSEYKYPLDTEKHVRAAMSYFSQHKGQYTPEEQKAIWKRIVKAAKNLEIEVSEEMEERTKSRSIMVLPLSKGKVMPIGTRSTHGGKPVVKTDKGWVPDTSGKVAAKKEDKPEKKAGERKQVGEYKVVFGDQFVSIRDKNIPKKYDAFVTRYTADEYKKKGVKLYTSGDGKSGYGIAADGDIISVFSGEKGRMDEIMKTAIANGARKLDCYGPFLPKRYAEYGFKVTGYDKWDDKYAPEGWNYEEFDHPNIYYMELGGKGMEKAKKDSESNVKAVSEGEAHKILKEEYEGMSDKHKKAHQGYHDYLFIKDEDGGRNEADVSTV